MVKSQDRAFDVPIGPSARTIAFVGLIAPRRSHPRSLALGGAAMPRFWFQNSPAKAGRYRNRNGPAECGCAADEQRENDRRKAPAHERSICQNAAAVTD